MCVPCGQLAWLLAAGTLAEAEHLAEPYSSTTGFRAPLLFSNLAVL